MKGTSYGNEVECLHRSTAVYGIHKMLIYISCEGELSLILVTDVCE